MKSRRNNIVATAPPFGESLSKGEKTKLRIIEASTKLIALKGLHNLTYEEIARSSKTTRQLVQTYYPDKDRLFEECIKLGRFQFQKFVIDSVEVAIKPRDKLKAYIDSTFQWINDHREKVADMIFFHHFCVLDVKKKTLNSQHADLGSRRIEALLMGFLPESIAAAKIKNLAKSIQNVLVGNLHCLVTEQQDFLYIKNLAKNSIEALINEVTK